MPTAGAMEGAAAMLAIKRTAPGPLGAVPAKHSVGRRTQPLPPLRVGQAERKLPLLSRALAAAAEQGCDREGAAAAKQASSIDPAHMRDIARIRLNLH